MTTQTATVEATEVKTYRERLMCSCGGEMLYDGGGVLLSSPPLFPHRCEKCGAEHSVRGFRYPRIVYKTV